MSTAMTTFRTGRVKEKICKSTPCFNDNEIVLVQTKTNKYLPKNQATSEQLRMARVHDMGGRDATNIATVKQLVEMTGRSEEDVVVALHDAQDDAALAVSILLDDEQGQGEWEVQDKKKKRVNGVKPEKEVIVSPGRMYSKSEIDLTDKLDGKVECSMDRSWNRHDRQGNIPPRAGERQRGFKPPRFAVRGRGRGRSHIRGNHSLGSVNEHSDVERPGFDECGVMRLNGEINEMTADAVDVSEDVKAHRRVAGSSDDEECCHIGVQNGDRLSDRRQHRRDDLDGRDRFGGRDRVRTYGGRYRGYGRGRGRGTFYRPGNRGTGYAKRFDRHNEHITSSYVDLRRSEAAVEEGGSAYDTDDDQWTGPLDDIKVFTQSQSITVDDCDGGGHVQPDRPVEIEQKRLTVEELFSSSAVASSRFDVVCVEQSTDESFFTAYNLQAAESIKNTIGIGSQSTRPTDVLQAPQSAGHFPSMALFEASLVLPTTSAGCAHSGVGLMMSSSLLVSGCASPVPCSTSVHHAHVVQRRLKSKVPPPSRVVESVDFSSPSQFRQGCLSNSQKGFLSAPSSDIGHLQTFASSNLCPTDPPCSHHSSINYSHNSTCSNHQAVQSASESSVIPFLRQYSSQTPFPSSLQPQLSISGQVFQGMPANFSAANSVGSIVSMSHSQYMQNKSHFPASNPMSVPLQPHSTQGVYRAGCASGKQFLGSYQTDVTFQNSTDGDVSQHVYQSTSQALPNSYPPSGSSTFYPRDAVLVGGSQQMSSENHALSVFQPSQTSSGVNGSCTVNDDTFGTQNFSAQHPSHNLQTSLSNSKLGDSVSKMSIADSDCKDVPSSNGSTPPTTVPTGSSMPHSSAVHAAVLSTSVVSVTGASPAVVTPSQHASRISSSLSTSLKGPLNIPPGMPLVNPLFMGQVAASSLPPYFAAGNLQGLHPSLYNYEDFQMLQQGRFMQPSYFDLAAAYSGVPSSLAVCREQVGVLGSVPFSAQDQKHVNRVDVHSPGLSGQQQTSHVAPQHTMPFSMPYGFYHYPGAPMVPGAAGYPYPMFPIPSVANAAAAVHGSGTSTAPLMAKNYPSHQTYNTKDDMAGGKVVGKMTYPGIIQHQANIGTASRSAGTSDLNALNFAKPHPHPQGFDKQGFPAGTPTQYNMQQLASACQAGPLPGPTVPYGPQFMSMMQPPSQTIFHHHMADSQVVSSRNLQPGGKLIGPKSYCASWAC